MPTVLITDNEFPDLEIERRIFNEAGVEVVSAQTDEPAEIIRLGLDANVDAILVQYGQITAEVFERLDGLDVVAKYGIGTDNIDKRAASEHGVPVLNVPTYCLDEVAEHALGLLLSCERKIHLLDESVKSGRWDWKEAGTIHRLSGRTLGVVGCGRIGSRFIELTRGFGFEVLGYDKNLTDEEIADRDAEPVDFESLLERSQVITIHVPLTADTEGLFDASAFERMRTDAILINTSRGPVVDTTALHAALVDGEVRGAGLDVLPTEPPGDSPLFDRDDVVLTPHIAWYSEDSIGVLRETVATDITRGLSGERPENIVNADDLTAKW